MEQHCAGVEDKIRRPRKIMIIKPSKYEESEALRKNKKYWNSVFNEIDTSNTSPTGENYIKQLSEALPSGLYERVCKTLNIPKTSYCKETDELEEKISKRLQKEPKLSHRKTIHIEREMESDTDVEVSSPRDDNKSEPNIHYEFLKKPIREQVTWPTHYLQPEREDEKNLIRKADDLTDKIAQDFCAYMKELGGDQQSQLFTPKAIKELFQIEFDKHVARSLRVIPKELPVVDEKIANVTETPDKSKYAALEREVSKDIKAEKRSDKTTAFGRSIPMKEQWRPPKNDTENQWRSARHVPRDLVTLKTVWEGITNLKSVKEYCRWMIEHPEYRRAPYLTSLGMFDEAVLGARIAFESPLGAHTPPYTVSDTNPAPIDQIRRRLSELVDDNENITNQSNVHLEVSENM